MMVEIAMSVATTEVSFPMTVGATYSMSDTPVYDGAYVFTPSSETQSISIRGKKADHDIVINPVPSQYGRITWNGSSLTVS